MNISSIQQTLPLPQEAIETFLSRILAQNPYINLLDYTLCTQDVVENGVTYKTYWLRKTET